MELTHRFAVPGSVDETWARFQDIGSLAECFPGAQVTSVEGDSFEGTVKVKLGPIALVYAGSGSFTSKDESAHTFLVEAKGRDKRGNGTAGANVTVTMAADGDGTSVEVQTDLAITGKPAQFGRGVMQDVSDKLLGQFVDCLEQKIGAEQGGDPPAASAPTPDPASASASVSTSASASAETSPLHDATAAAVSRGSEGQKGAGSAGGADAIDLGGALLPVLLRRYGRYAAGGLAVLVLVRLLVGRRCRH